VLRRLWERHGDRLRHWLAVVLTIVVVLSYMEWRDTEADWTVFVLAIGLLLVLEFLLQSDWLRRRDRRSRHRDGPPARPPDGPQT
jgi:general stress protein CsbA